ncbi:HNH endonuclease [Reinekea sp. G2M2-21]|uniref:HNH endonuclease n=1 Tax=Reinekea sp. G2M2-21 TaxID=2788942 RepID=UPI0018AC71F3|nr:HNH endonuclease [Reinekea sp. G2M2-21]
MNWLISANGKMYDHASSFAHFGSIDWRQGNVKYDIGDTVYIYCTNPIQRVRYKCIVTELNKSSSQIRDDERYWINKEEYEKSLVGKYFNLKLIEEVDSEKLSLSSLTEKGLKAAPQGPIKLNSDLEEYISGVFSTEDDEYFPDTIKEDHGVYEGVKKQVSVNKYERSTIARAKCIEAHGYTCKVCNLNFEETYGSVGKEFIHVHHIVPIHTIGESYKIDYINDLVPVCPNCHAMLHREVDGKYYSVSELSEIVRAKKA